MHIGRVTEGNINIHRRGLVSIAGYGLVGIQTGHLLNLIEPLVSKWTICARETGTRNIVRVTSAREGFLSRDNGRSRESHLSVLLAM